MALKRDGCGLYDETHTQFRETVRRTLADHVAPHIDEWEKAGMPPRSFWHSCASAGMLCPQVPEDLGGPGLDFTYNALVAEELGYLGFPPSVLVHSDIVADYLIAYGSDAQKQRWLPAMVSGAAIGAIAMTEPGTGSDLKDIRTVAPPDHEGFILNGTKTYITNGASADLVIVVAKSDAVAGARGMSLLLVPGDSEGLTRGKPLDKVGQHCGDTTELFFDDVRVPAENLLGKPGQAFGYLMAQLAQERLAIAVSAQATAQRAFDEAVAFTSERTAFGQRVIDFQNSRFTLAGLKAELQVGWAHIDWAIARHVGGELTGAEASAAKLWHTELQGRCCDAALQLHGGAGYMNEYPIARLWKDSRVTRIFGGTNEIMREIVGRAI